MSDPGGLTSARVIRRALKSDVATFKTRGSFTQGRRPRRRIAPEAIARCKARVRELTDDSLAEASLQIIKKLSLYLNGWRSYVVFKRVAVLRFNSPRSADFQASLCVRVRTAAGRTAHAAVSNSNLRWLHVPATNCIQAA